MFSAQERLRGGRAFREVYSKGRRVSCGLASLVVHAGMNHGRKFGISIGRKVGPAVIRNTVKRRIREVYRRHREVLPEEIAMIMVLHPRAGRAAFAELEAAFLTLIRRAGLVEGRG